MPRPESSPPSDQRARIRRLLGEKGTCQVTAEEYECAAAQVRPKWCAAAGESTQDLKNRPAPCNRPLLTRRIAWRNHRTEPLCPFPEFRAVDGPELVAFGGGFSALSRSCERGSRFQSDQEASSAREWCHLPAYQKVRQHEYSGVAGARKSANTRFRHRDVPIPALPPYSTEGFLIGGIHGNGLESGICKSVGIAIFVAQHVKGPHKGWHQHDTSTSHIDYRVLAGVAPLSARTVPSSRMLLLLTGPTH